MTVCLDKPASYRTRDAKRRVISNYLTAEILTTWRQLPNDMWYLIERAPTLAAMLGAIFSWSFLIWPGAISWPQAAAKTEQRSWFHAQGRMMGRLDVGCCFSPGLLGPHLIRVHVLGRMISLIAGGSLLCVD